MKEGTENRGRRRTFKEYMLADPRIRELIGEVQYQRALLACQREREHFEQAFGWFREWEGALIKNVGGDKYAAFDLACKLAHDDLAGVTWERFDPNFRLESRK